MKTYEKIELNVDDFTEMLSYMTMLSHFLSIRGELTKGERRIVDLAKKHCKDWGRSVSTFYSASNR